MAGTATLAGDVPETASSNAAAREAMKIEDQAAMKPLTSSPHGSPRSNRRRVVYTKYETATPTRAMLKRLAPRATSPPSWKMSA